MKIFGLNKGLTQLNPAVIALVAMSLQPMYATAGDVPPLRTFPTSSIALVPYVGEVNSNGDLVPTQLERRHAELKISTLIASDCRLDERVKSASARITPRNIFPSIDIDAERRLLIVKAEADCQVIYLVPNPAPYGY